MAFCPERIAEGHALEELHTLPQIIGCETTDAGDRAARVPRARLEDVRTTTKEAELAKLFTNTWRYIKLPLTYWLSFAYC